MNIEEHLDNVFTESAKQLSKSVEGKRCHYELDGMGYTAPIGSRDSGFCHILGVYYSSALDCNVYQLQDDETSKQFEVCEFEVKLTDI